MERERLLHRKLLRAAVEIAETAAPGPEDTQAQTDGEILEDIFF